jgi:flagellar assembly protein FliH
VERQEKNHVESLVKAEVDARILEMKEKAYQDGFEEGKQAGFLHAETEYRESVAPIHAEWVQFLEQADQIKKELYIANETLLIQLVFQIGKHVLLKEMGSDREYVKRLMIHVVEKLGAKENIKIKISRKDAENIESLKDFLKAEIPDLKNIQFEASDDLQLGGCKVETDLSRINASVENQLSSIEKSLGET